MHIPSTMLSNEICSITWGMAGTGLLLTSALAKKSQDKPTPKLFASVTAMIFALQMLNFTILDGISGHLIGSMIALSLLNIPFAVLSISAVLAIQSLFFADGGIDTLGANIFNMGIIGTGIIGIAYRSFAHKKIALPLFSALSVVAAAFTCSLELVISKTSPFTHVMPAMLSIHTLIGIGEALLTTAIIYSVKIYSQKTKKEALSSLIIGYSMLAALLSPLASSFPDGLEYVAHKLSFASFNDFAIPALFPDYAVPFISNSILSTITAGFIGVIICLMISLPIKQTSNK